ncbi:MAG: methyltransferase [Hyphomicrobiales bacterium]|nr:methyltransferase [Hyphomicrobiales bacterium]
MSLDHTSKIVKPQSLTRDAFLGGRLTVSQSESGFRAGLDSVLLGAAIAPQTTSLLDLGCGAGVAALVGLTHNPAASGVLLDSNASALALAELNVAENGFAARARVLLLDATARGALRSEAGLPVDHFTSVIANPPFFTTGRGTLADDGGRADARHMDAEALDLWVKTAAAAAAPRGEVIFIHTVESLAPLLAAFDARFGAVTLLPFLPRPGRAATRVLVRGIKGSRAPLKMLAPRMLHGEVGNAFAADIDPIFRGESRLIW